MNFLPVSHSLELSLRALKNAEEMRMRKLKRATVPIPQDHIDRPNEADYDQSGWSCPFLVRNTQN